MGRLPDSLLDGMEPPSDLDCSWVRQHVDAVLDRESSGEVGARLEEHLRACRPCAELVRAAREEERFLRAAQPGIQAPPTFVSKTMERLAESRDDDRTTRRVAPFLRIVLPALGAAAALVVVLALHLSARRAQAPGELAADRVPGTVPALPPKSARSEDPIVATLSDFSGSVELLNEGGASWARAEPGLALRLGATLRTTSGSVADLLLVDGVRAKLNGNSRARIKTSSVHLFSGRLFVWAERRTSPFAVTTPQATAEIRGTMFNVDSRTEGRTILTVVEGLVAFSNERGSVDVEAGMQSSAEGSAPPGVPRAVDVVRIASWAGIGGGESSLPGDASLRVRLDTSAADDSSGAPVFVVSLDYGTGDYTPQWLRSEVRDGEGRVVAESAVQVSTPVHRFRTKRVRFSDLGPGTYSASFRVGGGEGRTARTLEFAVR